MATNIFTLNKIDESELTEKINIEDLFEKKKTHDQRELVLFKRILSNIHKKIKLSSTLKKDEPFLWFVVPEHMMGYPKYDQGVCIGYIIDKLQHNKFLVQYYHPSLLYIYWGHIVPKYVRDEIKNKLGIVIDEYGKQVIQEEQDDNEYDYMYYNTQFAKQQKIDSKTKKNSTNEKYTHISSYNPTGNLTYNR